MYMYNIYIYIHKYTVITSESHGLSSMLRMPPAGGCEAGFAAGFGAVSCTIPMFEHRFPPKKKACGIIRIYIPKSI